MAPTSSDTRDVTGQTVNYFGPFVKGARYLDYNDSYFSPGGGHPSDMIPAVLALAEPMGADGRMVITAIVLAYEVFCRLSDYVVISELGWDQGMFSAIGEDADCTHRFPNEYNYHMEVTTTLGQRFSAATAYPQGHWCKPFSDAEVEHKFCSLAGDVLSEQQGHKTLECLWSLEQLPNLQTLVDGLVVTQG